MEKKNLFFVVEIKEINKPFSDTALFNEQFIADHCSSSEFGSEIRFSQILHLMDSIALGNRSGEMILVKSFYSHLAKYIVKVHTSLGESPASASR